MQKSAIGLRLFYYLPFKVYISIQLKVETKFTITYYIVQNTANLIQFTRPKMKAKMHIK